MSECRLQVVNQRGLMSSQLLQQSRRQHALGSIDGQITVVHRDQSDAPCMALVQETAQCRYGVRHIVTC
jgi:hypothetical protein